MTEADAKLLQGMDDSLFEDNTDSDKLYVEDHYTEYCESDIAKQEDISCTIAKSLLGIAYDPNCRYQLLMLPECSMVLKIDDRVTPEKETEERRHITEYPLESEGVQTLGELRDEVVSRHNFGENKSAGYHYDVERPKHWFYKLTPMERLWVLIFVLMLGIAVALFAFLFKVMGVI